MTFSRKVVQKREEKRKGGKEKGEGEEKERERERITEIARRTALCSLSAAHGLWGQGGGHVASGSLACSSRSTVELITSSVGRYRPAPTIYPLHNSTHPTGYLQAGLTLCRCCLVAHADMLHAGLSGMLWWLSATHHLGRHPTPSAPVPTVSHNPPPTPPQRNSSALPTPLPTQYAGLATAADL